MELIKQLIAGSNSQGQPISDILNDLYDRLFYTENSNENSSMVQLLKKIIYNQVGENSNYPYPISYNIEDLRYQIFGDNYSYSYNQSSLYDKISELENKVNEMNYLLQEIYSRLFGY